MDDKKINERNWNCKFISENITVYYPYYIEEGQRPDVLSYDVYVADAQKKSVFMVLVATYPDKIMKDRIVHNLEHFLNTREVKIEDTKKLYKSQIWLSLTATLDFFAVKTTLVLQKNYKIFNVCRWI